MGLRPLEIVSFFQRGDRFYTSESDVIQAIQIKSTFPLIPELLFKKVLWLTLVFEKLVVSTDHIIFMILLMFIAEKYKNK